MEHPAWQAGVEADVSAENHTEDSDASKDVDRGDSGVFDMCHVWC